MARIKDENKIRQIHEAALKLVLKTGFSSLKMADVAKEAGLATGTLYVYYVSKESLINALYVETKKEIVSVLLNPENQGESVYKTFKNMWNAYFEFCMRHLDKMIFAEQFLFSGLISPENIKLTEEFLAPLDDFLLQAMALGLIREMDVQILKAHMSGSLHEIVKYLSKSENINPIMDKELFFELTWNSIRK